MSDRTLLFSSNEAFCKVRAELAPFATSLVRISLVGNMGLFIHIKLLVSPPKRPLYHHFFRECVSTSVLCLHGWHRCNFESKSVVKFKTGVHHICVQNRVSTAGRLQSNRQLIQNLRMGNLRQINLCKVIYIKLSIACREHIHTHIHAFQKKYPTSQYTLRLHSICISV